MKNLKPKEKILAVILALLMILFGFLIWYFYAFKASQYMPAAPINRPIMREEPIKLNNTLKTSVTVLPAPEGTVPPAPQQ